MFTKVKFNLDYTTFNMYKNIYLSLIFIYTLTLDIFYLLTKEDINNDKIRVFLIEYCFFTYMHYIIMFIKLNFKHISLLILSGMTTV